MLKILTNFLLIKISVNLALYIDVEYFRVFLTKSDKNVCLIDTVYFLSIFTTIHLLYNPRSFLRNLYYLTHIFLLFIDCASLKFIPIDVTHVY